MIRYSLSQVAACVCAMAVVTIAMGERAMAQYVDGPTNVWLVNNAWFDADASGWALDSPWHHDPNDGGNLAFTTNNSNSAGIFKAQTIANDMTTAPNVQSLTNYSPDTALLFAFIIDDPWRQGDFVGTPPADGDYDFYLEIIIDTDGTDYTGTSAKLDSSIFAGGAGSTQFGINSLTWDTDPFAGLGVPLGDINSIEYNVVMDVVNPTSTSASGTLRLQGFNLRGRVATVIPEPASACIAGMGGILATLVRRRRI